MGWAGAPDRRWMLLQRLWRGARRVCGCARFAGWAWPAAARSTSWSATLPSDSRSPSTGAPASPASSAGAVQAAVAPAWGRVPLVLLIAGLGAYALTQLIEAVFRPSRAASAMGRWRQRAVSSWGFVLYLAFCLSTARLLAGTPADQTAQS